MKIGIYGQFYNEDSESYFRILLDALEAKGAEIVIEENFLEILKEKLDHNNFSNFSSFNKLDSSFNYFFSVGGDGTILKAVALVADLDIPIVGINTGRLGFLATIQKEELTNNLNKILNGEYLISERTLLSVETDSGEEIGPLNFALNEVAVNRHNTSSMIQVETWINDKYLTSYWSDGLIVATPTGSTGYSLSCGGPIIEPGSENFLLTPIAPHNLSARPLVVPDNVTLNLKVSGRENVFLLSLDSRTTTIEGNAKITIKKAPFTIKLLQLQEDSFIQTLRKKLLWGEDKRN